MRGLILILLMPLLACEMASVREDPYVGLGIQNPVLGKAKAAFVISKNSKNFIKSYDFFTKGRNKQTGDSVIREFSAAIGKNFGFAREVVSVAQAGILGVDVVVVVDVSGKANIRILRTASSEVDVTLLLFDTKQNLIDEIKVHVLDSTTKPDFLEDTYRGYYRGALKTAAADLARKIPASQKLTAFLKGMPSAGGTAVAAAPASHPASSADADKPKYSLREDPDKYAVVVGVESYQSLPKASYAKRDADAVRDHLIALGFPERNVIHLTDSRATVSGLKKYVEEWLPRNVNSKSTLFFYFSGHGSPDPKSGRAYIVPWDGDPSYLKTTAYPVERLYAQLAKTKAKNILVVLDACFSGAGGRSVLEEGARPLVTKVDFGFQNQRNISLLTAASSDEITTTLKDQRHGIFTYYFLKGLNGAAAGKRGRITAESLYRYLKPKVQDAARRQNRDQTPTYKGRKVFILR